MKRFGKSLGIFLLGAGVAAIFMVICCGDRATLRGGYFENAQVLFNKDMGIIMPSKGDRIVVEIITSTKGRPFTTQGGLSQRTFLSLPRDFRIQAGAKCTVTSNDVAFEAYPSDWTIHPGSSLRFDIEVKRVSSGGIVAHVSGDLPLQICVKDTDGTTILRRELVYKTLRFNDTLTFSKAEVPH